ncbi:MAG: hypothetical protein ACOC9T_00375 [Myxococcota bacterium]
MYPESDPTPHDSNNGNAEPLGEREAFYKYLEERYGVEIGPYAMFAMIGALNDLAAMKAVHAIADTTLEELQELKMATERAMIMIQMARSAYTRQAETSHWPEMMDTVPERLAICVRELYRMEPRSEEESRRLHYDLACEIDNARVLLRVAMSSRSCDLDGDVAEAADTDPSFYQKIVDKLEQHDCRWVERWKADLRTKEQMESEYRMAHEEADR